MQTYAYTKLVMDTSRAEKLSHVDYADVQLYAVGIVTPMAPLLLSLSDPVDNLLEKAM